MTQPTINTAGQALYDHVSPLVENDETYGWAALFLISALGAMAQGLNEVVEDTATRPAWAILFDPTTCPAPWLPWLAWLYGVPLAPGLTVAEQRRTIRDLPPHKRCTLPALKAAVQITLADDDSLVTVIERDGDAYHHTVRTYEVQTPNPAASEAAAWSQIPIDSILNFEVVPGWTWAEAMAHYTGLTTSWADVMTAAGNPTWTEFAHQVP